MVKLIKRCPQYTRGYKEYCQELYDNMLPILDQQTQTALMMIGFLALNHGMTRKNRDWWKASLLVFTIGQ